MACKDEHCGNDWMPYAKPQPDNGQFWIKLNKFVRGGNGAAVDGLPTVRMSPKIAVTYYPTLCAHCDDAPCIEACDVGAIYKRDDGIVIIDPAKCSGHRLCIDACPYGVIYYNAGLRQSQKCTGCSHLVDRGWPIAEPRCTDACSQSVLKFGEESAFSAEIAKSITLEPKFGAKPKSRVYYMNMPGKFIAGTVYDPSSKEIVEGATVTLSGAGSATATTDGWGDFWFKDLAVGTFSVKVEANGKSKTVDGISTESDVNLGDIALS
jgi:Fe-S-cluster-containing dehydrogenase component